MKTILLDYKNIDEPFGNLSICLGYFDGIHLGHQSLIENATKSAKYPLGLLTFDKPISTLVETGKSKQILTSLFDRSKIISRFGLDYFFILSIDKDFVSLSSDEFINILRKMGVREVFVGEDFRFGKNASGTIQTLKENFDVKVVDIKNVNDEKVSTQRIINLLKEGDIEKANQLLGHNYMISGSIEEGKHLGRTIGFPTLNLKLSADYVLPKFGVYKTIAYLDGIPHLSITNVGVRPTVNNDSKPSVETHIVSFNVDKNPTQLSVEFLSFVRSEKEFSSLEELKEQIKADIEKVF